MRMHHFVISAPEQEYVRRLAAYMRDAPGAENWHVTAFTHPPALKQYLRNGYPVDLLVAPANFLQDVADVIPAHVLTVELAQRLDDLADQRLQLLQYQPLPQLLHGMNKLYYDAGRGNAAERGDVGQPTIVASYSAIGGIGKSTLAMNMIRQSAAANKRCFYLNLETWNAAGLHLGSGSEGETEDLSHILYELQSEFPQPLARFRELRRRHAALMADYFEPATQPDERRGLTPQLVDGLLDTICASGDYELIVIDLDSTMDEAFVRILERCTWLFWLWEDEVTARCKTMLAQRYGKRKWGEAYKQQEGKIRYLQIGQAQSPGGNAGTADGIPAHGKLPRIPQWSRAAHAGQLLSSPLYRGAVDSILNGLIWNKEGGLAGGNGGGSRPVASTRTRPNRPERFRLG
ncbi:hypothetical protein EBB07_01675 [Paenibacillaceae bacterium]|nr:hypothetical protein EBB07_01675 [Paenibacillaceae bacterium]